MVNLLTFMPLMDNYVKKAGNIVDSLKLTNSGNIGMKRKREEYDFIVHYPSPLVLRRITDEEIYKKRGNTYYHTY